MLQQKMPWEEDWSQPQGVQVKPADPRIPLQIQKDQIGIQRDQAALAAAPIDQRKAAADAEKAELELQALRRKAADPTGALGVEQAKATGFFSRGTKANRAYEDLGIGAEPSSLAFGKALIPDEYEGYFKSSERQAADANIRAFIGAVLRYESGAAIPPDEFTNSYQTYFPLPGEGPEAIETKRRLRAEALEGLALGSGPGAQQVRQSLPEAQPRPTFDIGNVNGADATQQRAMSPGGSGIQLSDGQTQTIRDPALAGLNKRVSELLSQGAPIGQIAKLITDAGIPIQEVLPSLQQLSTFRKQNPNYRGGWDVRLDEQTVPMTGLRQAGAIASSGPIGAAGISAGNVVTGNRLDNLVEMFGGNGDLANIGMQAVREQNPVSSIAGDVAGGAGLYGAGRALLSRAPALLGGGTAALSPSAIAGDAALGAYIGSGQDGTDAFSPSGALKGAGIGAGAGIAGRGAINGVGRAVSPTGGRLAPLYEGNPDFVPSLGQRTGGAFGRFEEANASLPMVGALNRNARNAAIDQAQRGAFNQALAEIGDELPKGVIKGTQAHAYMQRAFNKIYDTARSGMTFRPDADFANDFGAVLRDVDLLPAQSQNVFKQLVTPVGARIKQRGGALTGADYKMMSSRIDAKVRAIRKNPNGDGELADALERFSVALDDGARRHSSPDAAALLDKADRGYVKSVIIENAARGAGAAGEFSGKALENAIRSGAGGLRSRAFLRGEAPLQDYAAAMSELGQTVADSGTFERLAATAGAGALGAGLHPATLAPSAISLGANVPGIKQAIGKALAPNRPRLAPVRKKIMDRARLGSLFGVPLLESQ